MAGVWLITKVSIGSQETSNFPCILVAFPYFFFAAASHGQFMLYVADILAGGLTFSLGTRFQGIWYCSPAHWRMWLGVANHELYCRLRIVLTGKMNVNADRIILRFEAYTLAKDLVPCACACTCTLALLFASHRVVFHRNFVLCRFTL